MEVSRARRKNKGPPLYCIRWRPSQPLPFRRTLSNLLQRRRPAAPPQCTRAGSELVHHPHKQVRLQRSFLANDTSAEVARGPSPRLSPRLQNFNSPSFARWGRSESLRPVSCETGGRRKEQIRAIGKAWSKKIRASFLLRRPTWPTRSAFRSSSPTEFSRSFAPAAW